MFLVYQAQYETKTAAAKVKKKHGKKIFQKNTLCILLHLYANQKKINIVQFQQKPHEAPKTATDSQCSWISPTICFSNYLPLTESQSHNAIWREQREKFIQDPQMPSLPISKLAFVQKGFLISRIFYPYLMRKPQWRKDMYSISVYTTLSLLLISWSTMLHVGITLSIPPAPAGE